MFLRAWVTAPGDTWAVLPLVLLGAIYEWNLQGNNISLLWTSVCDLKSQQAARVLGISDYGLFNCTGFFLFFF